MGGGACCGCGHREENQGVTGWLATPQPASGGAARTAAALRLPAAPAARQPHHLQSGGSSWPSTSHLVIGCAPPSAALRVDASSPQKHTARRTPHLSMSPVVLRTSSWNAATNCPGMILGKRCAARLAGGGGGLGGGGGAGGRAPVARGTLGTPNPPAVRGSAVTANATMLRGPCASEDSPQAHAPIAAPATRRCLAHPLPLQPCARCGPPRRSRFIQASTMAWVPLPPGISRRSRALPAPLAPSPARHGRAHARSPAYMGPYGMGCVVLPRTTALTCEFPPARQPARPLRFGSRPRVSCPRAPAQARSKTLGGLNQGGLRPPRSPASAEAATRHTRSSIRAGAMAAASGVSRKHTIITV